MQFDLRESSKRMVYMDNNIQEEKAWRNPNISSHAGIKCEERDRIGSNVGAKTLSLKIGVTVPCSCVRSHNSLKSADCFVIFVSLLKSGVCNASNRTLVRRQAVFCGESRCSMAASLQDVLSEVISCPGNPEGCVGDLTSLTDCGNHLMDRRIN